MHMWPSLPDVECPAALGDRAGFSIDGQPEPGLASVSWPCADLLLGAGTAKARGPGGRSREHD